MLSAPASRRKNRTCATTRRSAQAAGRFETIKLKTSICANSWNSRKQPGFPFCARHRHRKRSFPTASTLFHRKKAARWDFKTTGHQQRRPGRDREHGGMTHSKVNTILEQRSRSRDGQKTRAIGATAGNIELALQGRLRLSYLPRDSAAKADDIITTTGIGGIYPKDLIIGQIEEVAPDAQGLSLYAVVRPMAEIRTIHDVLVITQFEGQSSEQESQGLRCGRRTRALLKFKPCCTRF
jgi:hypothetical protein